MASARFLVYEHERLHVGARYPSSRGDEVFTEAHFDALARYQERTETPALRIGHRSVRFAHHVGYLRVGPVSVEIYPKLGTHRRDEDWRGLLLHMLRVVAGVRLIPQELAPLKARSGDLYELLLGRFLDLTQVLVREGLARSYREVEENGTAFRGRLLVGPHLRTNHVHQERLYVAYEVHDPDNLPNRMLWRALERVRRTTSSHDLLHRAESAVMEFPEVSEAPIQASDWERVHLDRRTERYREALGLARMILLEEHPDLQWGDRQVIALLFDMNALFEAYIEQALRGLPGLHVKAQAKKRFWQPAVGGARILKPDLLVFESGSTRPTIIDAKWKVPPQGRPADDDLRQIFAYLHAFGGERGILVYPRAGATQAGQDGAFLHGDMKGRTAFVDLFPAAGKRPNLAAFRAHIPSELVS